MIFSSFTRTCALHTWCRGVHMCLDVLVLSEPEDEEEEAERSTFDSARLFHPLFTCGLCGEKFNDEVFSKRCQTTSFDPGDLATPPISPRPACLPP